jgi:hypothetical protein
VTFQVSFTGALPIQFQWRRDGQPLPDATNPTLTLTNVQLADESTYSVIASNSFGAVEAIAGTLVILIKPTITGQPVSQSVVAGGNVVLSVAASGHPLPLSYRWRKNGGGVTNMILYETNCFFTVTNIQPNPGTNIVNYNVVVTNLAGTASLSSNAVLTVLADTDGDGLPDEWEVANALNPTDSADASLDSDGDGVPNRQEYFTGTDPQDPRSCLKVQSIRVAGEPPCMSVVFSAIAGKTYTLLRRDSADGGMWIPCADVPAASTNRVVEVRDSRPTALQQPQGFYRLATPRLSP